MNKAFALFDLFRKGSAVADPAVWKNRSALVMALSALIVTAAQVAKGYGYDLGIDNDTASAIAGGIAAAVGLFSTFATSDKVGVLPPKSGADTPAGADLPDAGA
jgi:uncharacterized membrane protein